jgi:DNA-directed RNA polymerase specialized sigma24 family protein
MSASGMTPLHSKASNHSLRDLQVSEDGRLVAIAKLRPRIREAVEIHQLQECSLNETADSLGISVAAVKGRLFHARAALRRVPRLKFALRRTSSVRRTFRKEMQS